MGPRFDRVSRAVLAAALLLIATSVGVKAYRLTLPTDGWAFVTGPISGPDANSLIYTENLLGLPSPLLPGDKLLAIEGQPFQDLLDRAVQNQVQPLGNWRVGSTARYTVERAGHTLTLDVPLYAWSLDVVLRGLYATPDVPAAILLALVGWFVFLRRPQEPAARPLLLFANCLLVVNVSNELVGISPTEVLAPNLVPIAGFYTNWIWGTVMFPSLLLLTLSFPRPKRLVGRYPVPVVALVYGIVPCLLLLLGPVAAVGWLGTLVFALLSLAMLVHSLFAVRDPIGRAQMRWAVSGLVVLILGVIPLVIGGFGLAPWSPPAWVQAIWLPSLLTVVALGFGIAILRYHLFDIDLIVNRVLVYGGLTACVVAIYALVVGYFSSMLEVRESALPSLVVTAIVAVLFQPVREWFQHTVDRLMYGERAEPYRVLARLGQRLESAFEPDAVLPTLVEGIGESLRLPYVAIALVGADQGEGASESVVAFGVPTTESVRFPLTHQGQVVGQLLVSPRQGEAALSETDRRLLSDLARQAGVAVHAVRLTADLERSNESLRAARERLVVAREEERRRLRRDLHDGLGPALASESLKVGAIRRLLDRDRAAADGLLVELGRDIKSTVDDVRRLVYDLRPPALDDLGLIGAIRESATWHSPDGLANHASRSPARDADPAAGGGLQVVEVDAPEFLPPLPAAVEVAAYRIVQEALLNVSRHARASRSSVRICVENSTLHVEIADDGIGLPADGRAGVGLHSMRERAEEVGGTLEVESCPSGGTRIVARLPLTEER